MWLAEAAQLQNLKDLIGSVSFAPGVSNVLLWTPTNDVYTVASFYKLTLAGDDMVDANRIYLFKRCWTSQAPPRVKLFVWLVLQEPVATKKFLFDMGIIAREDMFCSFCGLVENQDHLFLHCPRARRLWYRVFPHDGFLLGCSSYCPYFLCILCVYG